MLKENSLTFLFFFNLLTGAESPVSEKQLLKNKDKIRKKF
ncbi:hypothetical protein LEP1GSC013_4029 [Leptospira interrogans serovar Valbuzzi str. Duyster]|nr:hypothetical protein LEP1GSC013_4029 [Leptospira interrogans serovar Valbuzzi str. Duyster]ENO71663.1 hypothetical protein LEP1GSC012_3391 [Leptospira interrogans serovar Valbuzzi str. Valbuzzi]